MNKYRIVTNAEQAIVENEVSTLLSEGWQLAGGINVVYKHEHGEHTHIPGHLVYTQALQQQ